MQGLTWKELNDKYGITKATLNIASPNPGDILKDGCEYNGESDEMYRSRVKKLLYRLQNSQEYASKTILVVTHGLCMHTLIRLSGNNPYSSEFSNASLCVIIPTSDSKFHAYKI